MYNKYYILINIKIIRWYMLIIGLLSSQQEAEELKYIAKVCSIEERIHIVVRMQKIKEMLKKQ